MDILAALTDANPPRVGSCILQKTLDAVPADTPGLDALLAAVDSRDWSAPRLGRVLTSLGIGCSLTTIRMHRSKTCPCFIGA